MLLAYEDLVPENGDFQVITHVEEKAVFVLSFEEHHGFWSRTEFGRMYHVLSPGEGTALLGILLSGFRLFDLWQGKELMKDDLFRWQALVIRATERR